MYEYIQFVFEQVNGKDENAIVVQVKLGHLWQPVGYIPGAKVKKAMEPLKKDEIGASEF